MQTAQMSLIDLKEDKAVEDTHTATRVKQKIVDITGLDYNRFMRSVMLSQGEFAAFLKAKENERGELLERITGTEVYSDISRAAHERCKIEKEKLERLNLQIENVTLLSTEERTAFEKEFTEQQKISAEKKLALDKLREQLNWLKTLATLKTNEVDLKEKVEQLTLKKNNAQADLNKLAQHESTLSLQADLPHLESQINSVSKLNDAVQDMASNLIPNLQKVKNETRHKKQNAEKTLQAHKKQQEKIAPIIRTVEELLIKETACQKSLDLERNKFHSQKEIYQKEKVILKETTNNYEQNSAKNKELNNWLNENKSAETLLADIPLIKEKREQLNKIEKQLITQKQLQSAKINQQDNLKQAVINLEEKTKKLTTQLAEQESLASTIKKSIAQLPEKSVLEENALNLQSLVNHLNQQVNIAAAYQEKNKEITTLRNQYSSDKEELKTQETQLVAQEEKIQSAQKQLQTLEKLYEAELQVTNYENARKNLVAASPCPLCGATEHPYLQGNYQANINQTQQEKNQQKQLLEQLQASKNALEKNISKTNANIANVKKNGIRFKTEKENYQTQFEKINTEINLKNNIEAINKIQTLISETQKKFQTNKTQLDTLKKQESQLDKMRKEYTQQKEVLINTENELKNNTQNSTRLAEEIKQLITEIATIEKENNSQKENIKQVLKKYQLDFSEQTNLLTSLQLLQEKSEQYQTNKNTIQTLEKTITQTKAQKENLEKNQAEKEKQLASTQKEILALKEKLETLQKEKATHLQHFTTKTPEAERQHWQQLISEKELAFTTQKELLNTKEAELQSINALLKENKQRLQVENGQLQEFNSQFNEQLKTLGFENILSFKASILPPTTVAHLTQLKQQLQKTEIELNNALENNLAQQDVENKKALTTENSDTIKEQIEVQDEELLELNQIIGGLDFKLKTDAKAKAQFSNISETIALQKKEYARWEKLRALIGSSDGSKFSKFAQGLTLARLVILANKHLQKLNGRYRIQKCRDEKKELELEIIDLDQADAVRSMNSLSGGESFLVSLALALGLSDLAGRHTRIESLFIDEGFGTLDAETLNMAISTLENLQAAGKNIGIISHVEALKERIGVQIQVTKLSGGYSTLNVVDLWGKVQ